MKRKCKSCNKIKDIDVFRSERNRDRILKTCRACRTKPKKHTGKKRCKSQLLSLVGSSF